MSPDLIPMLLAAMTAAVLCLPPVQALRMLARRCQLVRPRGSLLFPLLFAAMAVGLVFNGLAATGLPGPLQAALPAAVADNVLVVAMAVAYGAMVLCVMLLVLAPHRRRSYQG